MIAKLATVNEYDIIKTFITHKEQIKDCNLTGFFNDEQGYKRILVKDKSNDIIGLVFFDKYEGEIAIMVNPIYIGKNKGGEVLCSAINWIRRYYPKMPYYFANCNRYSYELFEDFGFSLGVDGDYYYRN